MRRVHGLCTLGLILTLAGCVSRAEFDAAKQQGEICERDKAAAQKSVGDCETRLTSEAQRWDSIQAQLTTTLPQTLKDFQDERSKIIEIVPEQVRKEVGDRLDKYFVNVTKQFQKMDGKLEELKSQLARSREQLSEVFAATRAVDTKVNQTHEALLSERARRDEVGQRGAALVKEILEFDRARINCEKCKDRIKLKDEGREELLAFHASLIKRMQQLGEGAPEAQAR